MNIDLVGNQVLGQCFQEDLRRGGKLLIREFLSKGNEHFRIHGQAKYQVVVLGDRTAQSGFMLGNAIGFDDVTVDRQFCIGSFDAAS